MAKKSNNDVIQRFTNDPAAFRDALLVDTDQGPRRFGDIMDTRQRETFAALDPGWQRSAGYDVQGGYSRGWSERPRGSSKTSDLAVMAAWCLVFCKRPVHGIAAAVDKDQSRLLRDAIQRLVVLNRWLGDVITINKFEVIGRHDSRLEIISSDVAASWGTTPHFIVADEVTHWRGDGLWDSLFSSAAKRRDCLLLCIANAGFKQSWQWSLREAIRTDESWYFDRWEGVAHWISEKLLDEQRRLLPAIAYSRLWENRWTEGEGDALDPADIAAAVVLDGPIDEREDNYAYLAALDLGIKHDRSAVVVVGVHLPSGKVRVCHVRSWHPYGGEVDLQEVEDHVLALWKTFRLGNVIYDQYQAQHMAQRLRRHGMRLQEISFGGSNLERMAAATVNRFAGHEIELFNCPELIADLKKLRIEAKPWGIRLTAPKDQFGHCDCGIALSMVLPFCVREHLWIEPGEEKVHKPIVRHRDPSRFGIPIEASPFPGRGIQFVRRQ